MGRKYVVVEDKRYRNRGVVLRKGDVFATYRIDADVQVIISSDDQVIFLCICHAAHIGLPLCDYGLLDSLVGAVVLQGVLRHHHDIVGVVVKEGTSGGSTYLEV